MSHVTFGNVDVQIAHLQYPHIYSTYCWAGDQSGACSRWKPLDKPIPTTASYFITFPHGYLPTTPLRRLISNFSLHVCLLFIVPFLLQVKAVFFLYPHSYRPTVTAARGGSGEEAPTG
jgi:hypothetical protein